MSIEIIWEQVQPGFNYALTCTGENTIWLQEKPWKKLGLYGVSSKVYNIDEWTLYERPLKETKPVYTQERYDDYLPPRVGYEFLVGDMVGSYSRIIDFKNKKVIVLALTAYEKGILITFAHETYGIGCGMFNVEWVKPIDDRTDKEKLKDDIMLFEKENQSNYNYYDLLTEAIVSGKFHKTNYTGE